MIPFFCGQNPKCFIPSNYSYEMAIANLERSYLVVGLTEQMDDFFSVLEILFPTYFKNATHFWRKHGMIFGRERVW